MQKALAFGIALILANACAGLPPGDPSKQILVTFRVTDFDERLPSGSQRSYHGGSQWAVPLHTRNMVSQFAKRYDLIQLEAWPIESIGSYCVAFSTINITDTFLNTLRQDDRVDIVQPNNSFKGMTVTAKSYNDPLVDLQYGVYRNALEQLHAITRGEDVQVAVLDSAVDMEHPDLIGQIKDQHIFTQSSLATGQLHGTAVAGIIGAAANNGEGVVGLAPKADITVFGACDKVGDHTICSSFALAKALASIIEEDIDVLNISLAGPSDPLISKLISVAVNQDMIIVAAANHHDPTLNFPANHPGVIATQSDHDIWFASAEALSTQAGGGYQVFYGSSISAAGLSGMATLLRTQLAAPLAAQTLLNMLHSTCGTLDIPSALTKALNGARPCR